MCDACIPRPSTTVCDACIPRPSTSVGGRVQGVGPLKPSKNKTEFVGTALWEQCFERRPKNIKDRTCLGGIQIESATLRSNPNTTLVEISCVGLSHHVHAFGKPYSIEPDRDGFSHTPSTASGDRSNRLPDGVEGQGRDASEHTCEGPKTGGMLPRIPALPCEHGSGRLC